MSKGYPPPVEHVERPIMAKQEREEPVLYEVAEVVELIRKVFARPGVVGIQGFSITGRTEKSSINMKWGDTRIRRHP